MTLGARRSRVLGAIWILAGVGLVAAAVLLWMDASRLSWWEGPGGLLAIFVGVHQWSQRVTIDRHGITQRSLTSTERTLWAGISAVDVRASWWRAAMTMHRRGGGATPVRSTSGLTARQRDHLFEVMHELSREHGFELRRNGAPVDTAASPPPDVLALGMGEDASPDDEADGMLVLGTGDDTAVAVEEVEDTDDGELSVDSVEPVDGDEVDAHEDAVEPLPAASAADDGTDAEGEAVEPVDAVDAVDAESAPVDAESAPDDAEPVGVLEGAVDEGRAEPASDAGIDDEPDVVADAEADPDDLVGDEHDTLPMAPVTVGAMDETASMTPVPDQTADADADTTAAMAAVDTTVDDGVADDPVVDVADDGSPDAAEPPQDAPAGDVAAENAPADDVAAEAAPADDVAAEDAPADDAAADEVAAEAAPADEVAAEAAPADDVAAEDAPADEATVADDNGVAPSPNGQAAPAPAPGIFDDVVEARRRARAARTTGQDTDVETGADAT